MGNILHSHSTKVTLTGASGYLGARLASSLTMQGFEVLGLARRLTQAVDFRMESLDLFNSVALTQQLADRDAVVHLAATDYAQGVADPAYARHVTVEGTRQLLAACQSIKTFIYFSTIHVYGSPLQGKLSEDLAVSPQSVYAQTHWEAENLVREAGQKQGFTPIILRLANIVGAPASKENGAWKLVVHDLVRQALTNRAIVIQSPGNTSRNYFPMQDLLLLVQELLIRPFPGVMNVGNPRGMTLRELATLVQSRLRKAGLEVPITVPPDRSNLCSFDFDLRKLTKLGLSLGGSLDQDIDDIITHAKLQDI